MTQWTRQREQAALAQKLMTLCSAPLGTGDTQASRDNEIAEGAELLAQLARQTDDEYIEWMREETKKLINRNIQVNQAEYVNLLAAVHEMLPDYEKTTPAGADRIRKMLRTSG